VPAQRGSAVALFVPIFYFSRQRVISKRISTSIPHADFNLSLELKLRIYRKPHVRDCSGNPFASFSEAKDCNEKPARQLAGTPQNKKSPNMCRDLIYKLKEKLILNYLGCFNHITRFIFNRYSINTVSIFRNIKFCMCIKSLS